MLVYKKGPESDPFFDIYSDPGWLSDYDPPREFPFFLNLEPTNACDLDCVFCSRRLSRRPVGHMKMELAEGILDEAALFGGTAVRFAGWGEPLLHPEISELVAMTKRKGLRLKIYTNGLNLTPRLMDEFMEAGLDELQFSMQGLTPAQYEFNRRGARHGDLEKNVLMAAGRRGSAPKPFLSVLTSVLASEAEEADPGGFAEKWSRVADKVAVDLTNLNFVKDSPAAAPHLAKQSGGLFRGKCVDVFLAMEIKRDGSIQFCGQDSRGTECHTVGRFGETGLSEAWLSPKFERQRDLVGRALGHAESPVCVNCYHNTTKYDMFKKASGKFPGGASGASGASGDDARAKRRA
ncbi:MAG: radical SAM protein [Deltaproteobacteria bacterium]|nr:radical SAM protein [Deltaproteobacteria bacterium]